MAALVQLAGGVAHELNNIFTAVTGNLSLLDEGGVADEQSAEMIRDVVRSAQRGIELSAKLQAFAGHQPLRRANVDINDVILSTLGPLRLRSLSAIDVRFHLSDDDCIAFLDKDRLRDSIAEIARNARAAMPTGGRLLVETTIHDIAITPATVRRTFLRLSVTDTGRGMPPDVASRALDPLFTTKKQGINAGWGLSNCAGFIRQSGGQMTLSSQLGQGTRVEILLPLQRP